MYLTIKNKNNRIFKNCYLVNNSYCSKINDRIKYVCSIDDLLNKEAFILDSYFDLKSER